MRTPRLAALLLTLLLAAGFAPTLLAAEAAAPILDYRLAPLGYGEIFERTEVGTLRIGLPVLQVFSGDGRLIFEERGWDPDFLARLVDAVNAPAPSSGDPELSDLLPFWLDAVGEASAGAAVADAELVLVDYWAEWCMPCVKQLDMLKDFMASSDAAITLIKVEADVNKLSAEEQDLLSWGGER